MDIDALIGQIHPFETKALLHYKKKKRFDHAALTSELQLEPGQANQTVSWLTAKELIDIIDRRSTTRYELTDLGRTAHHTGTVEELLIECLRQKGPATMGELAARLEREPSAIGSAYGQLSRAGQAGMNADRQIFLKKNEVAQEVASVRLLLDRAAQKGELLDNELNDEERRAIGSISKKRGASAALFRISTREHAWYAINAKGKAVADALLVRGMTGDEIGEITPGMLIDGDWKGKKMRPYNIHVPPARVLLGRANSYGEYLRWVKDKLTSVGFEEFDGPLVETEFWNSDALFMPQFHSARDIHDVYTIAKPTHAKEIDPSYRDTVAKTHEDGWTTGSKGWQYSFDRDFTRRLILRSQGTALSAKTLPNASIPGKYFGIARCFRCDKVDATHLSDFYQTEGIVLGKDVNLRTLLGLLRMFAEEIAGAEDVRYAPGYFPFTEPSIEVHIKHPKLGWFELGGSGIFRPEVTEPLGVDVPVLAWGLGIDRMAMMRLGLSDLRELFTNDLEQARLRVG